MYILRIKLLRFIKNKIIKKNLFLYYYTNQVTLIKNH